MITCSIVALILLMVIAAVVQDLRLRKKVDSIERMCVRLNGRTERRVLLRLRCGRRNEPLLLAAEHVEIVNLTSGDRPILTEAECGLRLLQTLNLIDTEARRGRAITEPLLRAA
jgi:hypothetical protein